MQITMDIESLDDAYLQFAELLISARVVGSAEDLVSAIIKSAVCICSCDRKTPVDAFYYLLRELQEQVNAASTGQRIEIESEPVRQGRRHEPLQ